MNKEIIDWILQGVPGFNPIARVYSKKPNAEEFLRELYTETWGIRRDVLEEIYNRVVSGEEKIPELGNIKIRELGDFLESIKPR